MVDKENAAITNDDPNSRNSRRALYSIIIFIVGGVGFVIWWYAGLRNQFFPDNFGAVDAGKLYRSAQISERVLKQTLLDHNIQVIVDLAVEDTPDNQAERRIAREIGVEHVSIYGLNGRGVGNPEAYPQAIRSILAARRENKAVLVHCSSGAQRTSGVIALYRILYEGKTEQEAFEEARQFHFRPTQNPHLIPFFEQHFDEWKAELKSAHRPARAASTTSSSQ